MFQLSLCDLFLNKPWTNNHNKILLTGYLELILFLTPVATLPALFCFPFFPLNNSPVNWPSGRTVPTIHNNPSIFMTSCILYKLPFIKSSNLSPPKSHPINRPLPQLLGNCRIPPRDFGTQLQKGSVALFLFRLEFDSACAVNKCEWTLWNELQDSRRHYLLSD